jgi:hypothetical protein
MRGVFEESLDQLTSIDRPLLRTIVGLTLRPGHVAAEYVAGPGRRLYASPLKYCIGATAVDLIVVSLVRRLDPKVQQAAAQASQKLSKDVAAAAQTLQDFMGAYLPAITILTLPILALLLRLLFPRQDRNVAENMAVSLYAYGHAALFQAVLLLLTLPLSQPSLMGYSGLVAFLVLPWAAVGFYRGRSWLVFLKAFLASILYTAAFSVMMVGVFFALVFIERAKAGGP